MKTILTYNRKWALLIIALLASFLSVAQELKPYRNLSGNWHFSIGDNAQWASPEFNHSQWQTIRVPSAWEHEGFNGYDGLAWYRKWINFSDDEAEKSLWLELGYIDDVSQIYFNGTPIQESGRFPPRFKTAYNARRLVKIPEHLIRKGERNLVAVRVYDAYHEGGIVSGQIRLLEDRNPLKLEMNLEGWWKFKTGDDEAYKSPSFNDYHWQQLWVPRSWDAQGYNNYNGLAWYRTIITLKEATRKEKLVLLLGKIDDVDEVYINGELIGQTGEISSGYFSYNLAFKEQRGYLIPEHLYKNSSQLTIAVRVYDDKYIGGIYEGPVGIVIQKEYIRYWHNKR